MHEALCLSNATLPSSRLGRERAQLPLSDDLRVDALVPADRAFLRAAFDDLLAQLDHRPEGAPLHGEPHDGNYLLTPAGLRWIDFESACRGPLEWDLAFLPDDARVAVGEVDRDLLELLKTLNSARVATWCWVRARFPEMRRHGEHQLEVVRRMLPR